MLISDSKTPFVAWRASCTAQHNPSGRARVSLTSSRTWPSMERVEADVKVCIDHSDEKSLESKGRCVYSHHFPSMPVLWCIHLWQWISIYSDLKFVPSSGSCNLFNQHRLFACSFACEDFYWVTNSMQVFQHQAPIATVQQNMLLSCKLQLLAIHLNIEVH